MIAGSHDQLPYELVMVSGSWVLSHSRPAPHDLVVMVIREAMQYESASD